MRGVPPWVTRSIPLNVSPFKERMMSSSRKVRVAVNGYGVIGKRVADAVTLQPDMELAGVADVSFDYRVRVAVERGYRVYASAPEKRAEMLAAGLPIAGDLELLLKDADIVVDCTPKRVGATNKAIYERAKVKAIWQGGEKHSLAGYSFVAQVNYDGARNRDTARVVSCNTTGLCRLMGALHARGWVKRARAVLLRRGTDPWESHKNGLINTVIPETKVPSHQGPDAQAVIPNLDITTMAGAGPYNLSHIHYAMVETGRPVGRDEVYQTLAKTPRVAFVRAADGLVALNTVIELMRDLRRPRGDMWEVAVWEDALTTDSREIYLAYQVHNEAIVIPENIDCIRALTGLESSAQASIELTDSTLGIMKSFLPSTSKSGQNTAIADTDAMRAVNAARAREANVGFTGAEEPFEGPGEEELVGARSRDGGHRRL